MGIIRDIFVTYAPEYLKRFGSKIPSNHKKAIFAILKCKSGACGSVTMQCHDCRSIHLFPLSCGNRHCPNCQHSKSQKWIVKQTNKLLPGHYFMVTFTVPEQLRFFIRNNQKDAYNAMFASASDAMKLLAADPKHIGGDLPGFWGVLHTWGRTLQYHPHIHFIVPGGALSRTDSSWSPSRNKFYLPVAALSRIYKAKFKDDMRSKGLLPLIPSQVWTKEWNVNCQPIGDSESSIKYLAPYVFRVAISNSRVIKVEDRKVYFRYKKQKSKRFRVMSLDVMEFIRRFLQHVLPTGYMKIRYYGFLSPGCPVTLDEVRERIVAALNLPLALAKREKISLDPVLCPHCQGCLLFRAIEIPIRAGFGLPPPV